MVKDNFWMISLCALLLIASATEWNLPIRVAVAANAVIILLEVARDAIAIHKANKEAKQ